MAVQRCGPKRMEVPERFSVALLLALSFGPGLKPRGNKSGEIYLPENVYVVANLKLKKLKLYNYAIEQNITFLLFDNFCPR